MLYVINEQNSVCNNFLAEIRDKNIHTDPLRFRRNLERIGEIMAYEISKQFRYKTVEVETPINKAYVNLPENQVVVASVLRAGLPYHQGFLNYFDKGGNAFISARRVYHDHNNFEIRFDSIYTPDLKDKQLIVVDPMLATGASLVIAYKELIKQGGIPLHTHIATIIASKQGIEYVKDNLDMEHITIWAGAVDEKLTPKAYIDPGIGDAGDLAYGEKI